VRSSGSVYRRCGCRSVETGRQLGRECLRLEDAGHGSWCFAVDVPRYPDGCSRPRVRRGGYSDRDSAVAALQELRSPVSRFDAPSTVSTGGWLRTWLGSRVSLATATATAYGFHIRLHLELALGRIPPGRTALHVVYLLVWVAAGVVLALAAFRRRLVR